MTEDEAVRLQNFIRRMRARGETPERVRELALAEVGARIAPRRTLKGILAQREEADEVFFRNPPAGSPEDLARLKDPTRLTDSQRHDVELAGNIAGSETDCPGDGRFKSIRSRRRHVQVARAKAFDQNVNVNVQAIVRES